MRPSLVCMRSCAWQSAGKLSWWYRVRSSWFQEQRGIWLFYVQHTFEDSYFEEDDKWEYVKAAVEGSSFYKPPKVLQWLTGNIGFHHIHHLSPRVPNYNLESAHYNTAELKNVPTITLSTSLKSLRFRLWDEEAQDFTGYGAKKANCHQQKQSRAKTASVKP